MAVKRVIIDTDAGVDDTLAIILALCSPELRIQAITTVSGNVPVDLCTRNVLLILEHLQVANPPIVARGEAQPLVRLPVLASDVHGQDGIGNITFVLDDAGRRKYPEPRTSISPEPAPELIARLARELGGDLQVVALGPLTNVARAIELDRDAVRRLEHLTIMGGAFREYGNTSLVAEFNIYADPEAARAVVELDVPKTIIPLDVTHRVILTRDRLACRAQEHQCRPLELARDASAAYMDFYLTHEGFDGCYIHDALAMASVIDPSLLETRETIVSVEITGEFTSGMTLAELRPERLRMHREKETDVSGFQSRAEPSSSAHQNPETSWRGAFPMHRDRDFGPMQSCANVAVAVDSERFLQFFLDRISGCPQG